MSEDSRAMGDKIERAYHHLRDAIIQGRLVPLEPVDQNMVAEQLNCSRMPVRQALIRLSLEGLVTYVANKGATVTALSMDDMVEIYSARSVLEPLLANVGARQLGFGQLVELKNLLEQQRYAVQNHDSVAFLKLDEQLHNVIYRASRYEYVCGLADQLRQKALRYMHVYASTDGHLQASLDHHVQIVEGIQSQDYDLVAHLTRVHVESGMEELAKVISLKSLVRT